jgi:hypothetical protein
MVMQSSNYQQPDRVAIDSGAHRSSGIQAMACPNAPQSVRHAAAIGSIDEEVLQRLSAEVHMQLLPA